MPAGGMSTDVEPVRIATKTRGVLVNPGNAAANLIGHHLQIAARRLDCNEVEHHEMCTGIDEHFCRIGVVLGFADQPCTTMDEHEYWRIRPRRAMDVELLGLGRPIRFAPWCSNPRARQLAVARQSTDDLGL